MAQPGIKLGFGTTYRFPDSNGLIPVTIVSYSDTFYHPVSEAYLADNYKLHEGGISPLSDALLLN